MLERIFDSGTQTLLNRALDAAGLRNEVTANNIANVDTPDFKRSEVLFEDKVKQALNSQNDNTELSITNPRHIQINGGSSIQDLQPEVKQMNDLSYRNDGNNVDIDTETANMTKNNIFYEALSDSMNNELGLLRLAITGRK